MNKYLRYTAIGTGIVALLGGASMAIRGCGNNSEKTKAGITQADSEVEYDLAAVTKAGDRAYINRSGTYVRIEEKDGEVFVLTTGRYTPKSIDDLTGNMLTLVEMKTKDPAGKLKVYGAEEARSIVGNAILAGREAGIREKWDTTYKPALYRHAGL